MCPICPNSSAVVEWYTHSHTHRHEDRFKQTFPVFLITEIISEDGLKVTFCGRSHWKQHSWDWSTIPHKQESGNSFGVIVKQWGGPVRGDSFLSPTRPSHSFMPVCVSLLASLCLKSKDIYSYVIKHRFCSLNTKIHWQRKFLVEKFGNYTTRRHNVWEFHIQKSLFWWQPCDLIQEKAPGRMHWYWKWSQISRQ